jgi:hypothetical protein
VSGLEVRVRKTIDREIKGRQLSEIREVVSIKNK